MAIAKGKMLKLLDTHALLCNASHETLCAHVYIASSISDHSLRSRDTHNNSSINGSQACCRGLGWAHTSYPWSQEVHACYSLVYV